MGKDSEKGQYKTPEGSYTWEYLSTLCCTLLTLCLGNVVGWNSPILGKLMAPDSPISLTATDASTMAAVVSFGHMVAPSLTVVMSDKLGRKMSLLITGVPLIVSWGLIAVAKHVMVLFVARLIAGLSIGLSMCISPMYLGEISSPKLRGGISMLSGIMFNFGVLFTMTLVPYVSVKVSACICLTIALAFVISFSFMPESPYFLAMIGKLDEAEAALEKLRGKTDVSDEMELIKLTLRQRRGCRVEIQGETKDEESSLPKFNAFKQLCSVPGNRKAFGIMMLFISGHYFGGFVTVMIYGHVLFTAMGVGVEAHICTMIVAILQLIVTVVATFLVDRVGRRPLICVSGMVSGICLGIIGTYFYLMEHTGVEVRPYAMIPFYAVFVLVVAANLGLMPMQNVVLSEIFDTDIKALASCIFGVIGGLISTIVIKLYLLMATTWGFGQSVPFLTFTVMTWATTAGLMKLLPETKGKTFLQIQKDLNA